jgi:putative addiction module CopG family antidote
MGTNAAKGRAMLCPPPSLIHHALTGSRYLRWMLLSHSVAMKISLSKRWKQFVTAQVHAGEFGNVSEVLCEALRLLRDHQESRAQAEMRSAFAGVDPHGGAGEPTQQERTLIGQIIRRHRKGNSGA